MSFALAVNMARHHDKEGRDVPTVWGDVVVHHSPDPNGNILVVLESPNATFAPWVANGTSRGPGDPADALEPKNPNDVIQCEERIAFPLHADELKAWQKYHQKLDPSFGTSNRYPSTDPSSSQPVRVRCSSKHLALASTYFRRIFEGPWKENTNDSTGSPRTVQALNWDKQALLVILNIIHGRTRAVPRHINLEMLAKIAVMVDYYGCLEAVEHFVEV
jgi:hypothetical protein